MQHQRAREDWIPDMSVAESLEALREPGSGNYKVARFNALRHGVLSRYIVLPWEDGDEYRALLEALVAEHHPQGPTEEHLVEELAGVIWRKRRLRLGERAAHHRALKRATESYQETAKAALIHIAYFADEIETADEAIRTTDAQTAEDRADLERERAMIERILALLKRPSPNAYARALDALDEWSRELWEDQLTLEPDQYEEGEIPYRADAESLRRYVKSEVLPGCEKRQRLVDNRPLLRAQAFGEAVEPDRLARLARYEVHLDRKLERTVAMLLKLQELRGAPDPG
jgi:hypothetical protein